MFFPSPLRLALLGFILVKSLMNNLQFDFQYLKIWRVDGKQASIGES